MMMIVGDTDKDGVLTPKEIQAVREKVLRGVNAGSGRK
jgi:hypothetical protein